MTHRSLPGVKEECNYFSHGQTGEGFVVAKRRYNREKSKLFSGLSLVLNKEGFVTEQDSHPAGANSLVNDLPGQI